MDSAQFKAVQQAPCPAFDPHHMSIDERLQRVRKSAYINTDLAVRFVLAEISDSARKLQCHFR